VSGTKTAEKATGDREITLFMCGDVMTGRGIDQILPHPVDPTIHEPYLKNAAGYVQLAEKVNGPIAKPVSFSYIWGDALNEIERLAPDLRIVNLETAITKSDEYWRGKEIHYRMNSANVPCLEAAKIDYCSLANNHVLDWGYSGLTETLETLKNVSIKSAGAGKNVEEAKAPATFEVEGKGEVIVFSLGSETSGIPSSWAASKEKPGVNLLRAISDGEVEDLKHRVEEIKRRGRIVVASIHWGPNWGYSVYHEERAFAHKLVDEAGVDLIHGHSSHHAKGIEVYRDRLILYGCGDFLNDYEGIGGYESFRGDLGLIYFATVEPSTNKLRSLKMIPTQVRRFRVNRASRADALWLRDMFDREGRRFGTRAELNADGTLTLVWGQHA
jgi:poly-gamma-glutamate synthesis protein (capsule biosynthesis protein)